MSTVRVGLIQTWADESGEENVERTLALVATAAERGAEIVCLQELFRTPLLLPDGGRPELRPRRADPRRDDEAPRRGGEAARHHAARQRSSRSARRVSSTTPRCCSGPTERSGASTARCTSPTTRASTRSSTSRPATSASCARRGERHRDRHARLLGPVVPRGGASHRHGGREDPLLPDRDRHLAGRDGPEEHAASGVADHAALSRDRQRGVRGGGEPHRRGGRVGVLGALLRGRTRRHAARRGRRRTKRCWSSTAT